MPEISVVIPTIGRPQKLARVLSRLEAQSAAPPFEAVVVIDAADEETDSDRLVSPGLDLRFLRATRAGASAARNEGVAAAKAGVVLFLDDDVLPESRLIAEHAEWHRANPAPEIGVLGHVRWADELRITPFMHWVERGIQFDYHAIQGIEAGWGRFYTANASVKRALVDSVGGFDEERLPFGYEDLDLAYRMTRKGFRLLYNRAASAEHLHPMDLDFWRRRVRRVAFAERRFCQLHPEIEPFFFNLFHGTARAPSARGRGTLLIKVVHRGFPLLGRRAWTSADLYFKQALAPSFLEAWAEAATAGDGEAQPDLLERDATSSGGS